MKHIVFNNYFQQGFAIYLNYVDEPYLPDPITISPGIADCKGFNGN